jgi:outer membrane protein, heavy metal efflux system
VADRTTDTVDTTGTVGGPAPVSLSAVTMTISRRVRCLVAASGLMTGCVGGPDHFRPRPQQSVSTDATFPEPDPNHPPLVRGPLPTTDPLGTVVAAAGAKEMLPVVHIDSLPPVADTDVPAGEPVALAELQRLAFEKSPTIRQAEAEVAAAHGAAVQAGLHPNPTVGYQGEQIGSGNSAGQQGGFIQQTIVTHGKLGLAREAALADVARAEARLQEARADLAGQVRARYFAFTTAAEAVRITDEMDRSADALHDRQRRLRESKQAAPHEVSQARALATQARGELLHARNRQTAAWKQLAATVGSPDMPMPAAGSADVTLPAYSFDALKRQILTRHTDLQAAEALLARERLQVELARVTPYPNIETNTYVQHDYSTRTAQFGVQIGVALPVFDRNQGRIAQAEANLVRASHEANRVRLDLIQRLTEAFERYATNRRRLEQYRVDILPDQLQAFQGISKRFEQELGKVSFSEVVLAQQTLARTYADYLSVLGAAWQAVAELSRLVQMEDLYRVPVVPDAAGMVDTWPEPVLPATPGKR